MPIRNYSTLLVGDIIKLAEAVKANEKTSAPDDDKTFLMAKIENIKRECSMILSVIKPTNDRERKSNPVPY